MTPSEIISYLKNEALRQEAVASELRKFQNEERVRGQMPIEEYHEVLSAMAHVRKVGSDIWHLTTELESRFLPNKLHKSRGAVRSTAPTVPSQDAAFKTLEKAGIPKELIIMLMNAKKK